MAQKTLTEITRDYYRSKEKDPVKMARYFRDLRPQYSSQTKMAEAVGMTTGTVTHYLQLLSLPDKMKTALSEGTLSFKVGRAFACSGFDHERIKMLARPFLRGEYSSVIVERYIVEAKKHPRLLPPDLKNLCEYKAQPVDRRDTAEVEEVVTPTEVPVVRPDDVVEATNGLIHALAHCKWDETIDALQARRLLKALESRLDERMWA